LDPVDVGSQSYHLTVAWPTPQVIMGASIFRPGFQCSGRVLCLNTDTSGLTVSHIVNQGIIARTDPCYNKQQMKTLKDERTAPESSLMDLDNL
jgi:hypothetical protein